MYRDRDAKVCKACRVPEHKLPKLPRHMMLGQRLSLRESQIAGLISEGKLNKEIAGRLGLTTGTIKVYVYNVFKKTGHTNRTELAIWWLRKQQTDAFAADFVARLGKVKSDNPSNSS